MTEGATVISLSSVPAERVDWLWPGRIPAGKLVLVEGDPGMGKSTMTLDLAARLSSGTAWPDGAPSVPDEVLLMSAEDGLADTIVPRLEAANADLSMIHALTSVPLRGKDGTVQQLLPSIPRDIKYIEEAIKRFDARLVIIDPLNAFLGSEIDSYKDQDVRRALTPLSKLAEATGCTFMLVRHLNKTGGTNARYRGQGSIGIGAASRAQFVVAEHPDDSDLRVFAPVKFNLGPMPPPLAFRLVDDPQHASAQLEWESAPVQLTAEELLAPSNLGPISRPSKNGAIPWLKEILSDGPVLSKEIYAEAEDAGYSVGQVRRAMKTVGVDTDKGQRRNGPWIMSLPESPTKSSAERVARNRLEESE